ncbi:hypothetical protein [Halobacterium yunchengense]|uniref:hypothetical protein n=1 Tax=Halobacterium yunchengense TaxID=3108497 RepID=UPI0030086C7F
MVAVEFVLLGLVLAFFGFGAAYNAREVARKDEQYDAIGSQRDPLDARPAGWKVSLTRWLWAAVGVAGVAFVVLGFVW